MATWSQIHSFQNWIATGGDVKKQELVLRAIDYMSIGHPRADVGFTAGEILDFVAQTRGNRLQLGENFRDTCVDLWKEVEVDQLDKGEPGNYQCAVSPKNYTNTRYRRVDLPQRPGESLADFVNRKAIIAAMRCRKYAMTRKDSGFEERIETENALRALGIPETTWNGGPAFPHEARMAEVIKDLFLAMDPAAFNGLPHHTKVIVTRAQAILHTLATNNIAYDETPWR